MPGFEYVGKEEKDAVCSVFDKNNGILFAHGFDALRNNHFLVREFEKKFAQSFQVPFAQAVTSGSTALLVGLKALGVSPGDEVITQSFTFVATVEAILMLGATPILTEIDESFNMDPEDLKKKITSKTKVIIPVHMAGGPADMDPILKIAREKGIAVLEDTAQGIGASYDGKPLGTLGDIGCFSLDFGKTVTTGEGGVVVTAQEKLYRESLAFHDHGHEYNPNFGRAEDTRATWGFNFRMMELQAAVGLVQLDKKDRMIADAKKNKAIVKEMLMNINGIHFRKFPQKAVESADSLYFYFDDAQRVKGILSRFKENGVGTKNVPDALRWHFAADWEHMFTGNSPYANGAHVDAWPKSKDLLQRTIALPVMGKWSADDAKNFAQKVVKAIG